MRCGRAWQGRAWLGLAWQGMVRQGVVWINLIGDNMLEKNGEHRTCLERQMHGYLTALGFESGVDFYEQYPVGHYLLDFAFIHQRKPFRGLDIETDGVLWHSSSKQRQRDGYRTYKLIKQGWQVERFGETFTKSDVENILVKHGVLPSS